MVLNPPDFDTFYQNVTDNVCASSHSIYCLTETWLNDTIFSHNPFPASCSVFHADRDYLNSDTIRGDGVLITVSNLLQVVMRRHDLETTKECVWIEISVSGNLHLSLSIAI
jgi:hypothetical protein